MIIALFEIECLAWLPFIGLALIAGFCAWFFVILVEAVIAECCGYPMPLDTRYFIGKFNTVILMALGILGVIIFII